MKKKYIGVILAVVIVLAVAGGLVWELCRPPQGQDYPVAGVRILSDADRQCKEITRVADQKRILRTLDRLEKSETEDPHLKGCEGILIQVRYANGVYDSAFLYECEGVTCLRGLGDTHYRVEAGALEKLTVLYGQMDYPAINRDELISNYW